MRDTRESRLLLVLLIAIAFALITVDIRAGEESPVDGARQAAAAVFGPVEKGMATAVDPVANAIGAVRDSDQRHSRIATLERDEHRAQGQAGHDDQTRSRIHELDQMLKRPAPDSTASSAEVIAIGAAQASPGPSPSTRAARTASNAT